jgi:hypothetical protein
MTSEVVTTPIQYYVFYNGNPELCPLEYSSMDTPMFSTQEEAVTWMQNRVAEAVADPQFTPQMFYPQYYISTSSVTVSADPVSPPPLPPDPNEPAPVAEEAPKRKRAARKKTPNVETESDD